MAPTATMTFTHPGGRARVAYEKTVPAATSTMAPTAVVQAISWREAQAAIATSTAPRQASRNRMEFSGSPGWLARRTAATTLMAPATARARRRPALRRSATAPRTGPAASLVPRRTGHPALEEAHDGARAPSATRSAASGSAGSSDRDRHRLGRRLLQLPHHQVARVGRRAPMHEAPGVAGHVRAGARGRPMSDRGRSRTSPVPSSGRRGTGWARPQRGDTWSAEGRGSRTRFVHHCNANGAAEATSRVDRVVDTAPHRQQRDDAVGPAPPAGRPDERLGTGWVDGTDAHPAAGPDLHLHRRAGDAVTRRAAHADPRPGHDHKGPDDPDEEGAEDEVAEDLHPPGPAVVGDQPPHADDQHARDHRRPRAGRPRPAAHGLGAGVVSRSSRITAADCRVVVGLDGEDAMGEAGDGHRLHVVGHHVAPRARTAWAWAARRSQMAARGLAPRCTPGAVRLARQISTA